MACIPSVAVETPVCAVTVQVVREVFIGLDCTKANASRKSLSVGSV
jgi:hypothetical protein